MRHVIRAIRRQHEYIHMDSVCALRSLVFALAFLLRWLLRLPPLVVKRKKEEDAVQLPHLTVVVAPALQVVVALASFWLVVCGWVALAMFGRGRLPWLLSLRVHSPGPPSKGISSASSKRHLVATTHTPRPNIQRTRIHGLIRQQTHNTVTRSDT